MGPVFLTGVFPMREFLRPIPARLVKASEIKYFFVEQHTKTQRHNADNENIEEIYFFQPNLLNEGSKELK